MPLRASQHFSRMPRRHHPRNAIWFILFTLLILALACSLPSLPERSTASLTPTESVAPASTPAPPPLPSPTPQPLPPNLVESEPLPGAEIPLSGPITLYFNQPMDRTSVEMALAGLAGSFNWSDDATLTFTPEKPFAPASEIDLSLDETVRAANGLALAGPVNLHYRTTGFLRLAERLPEPGSGAVDPTSAVVAAFNRPVVPLGGDPATRPPAFSLEPAADGRGEWLNTSTYVFYPEPALAGGIEYTVTISPNLTGADGSPLESSDSWSFTTMLPRLDSIHPLAGSRSVRLDAEIILTFNQPMDPDSLASNFALLDPEMNNVPGDITWNEDFTVLTFIPTHLLKRDLTYTVVVDEQAVTQGGTPLGSGFQANLRTVPFLRVLGSEPLPGGPRHVHASVTIYFDAPIHSKDVLQFVTFSPDVPNLNAYTDEDGKTLRLYGDFTAETNYTLIISPNLPDAWNGRLGQEYILNFYTLPLEPDLVVTLGSDILFLTPADSSLDVQVTNLPQIPLSLGSLPLEDFMAMIAPGGYELRQTYQPSDRRNFQQFLELPSNRSERANLPLSIDGNALSPGLYHLSFGLQAKNIHAGPFLLVVSNVHLAFKSSATDALVWAVDLRENAPVTNAPVTIYNEEGAILASGLTNAEGIFRAEIPTSEDPYTTSYAMLGQPGEDTFSLALSNWNQGLDSWAFGLSTDYGPPRLEVYLYTDRPIYRPGQTVYFRAIARQAYNGRYSIPDLNRLPITMSGDQGEELTTFALPLSAFGTAHGSYTLPADAVPGYYRLSSKEAGYSGVSFQVAEYRKPEFNLEVSFNDGQPFPEELEQALAGETLHATVEARYFFDAPAGNVAVQWSLYREPSFFHLPGYQAGPENDRWLATYPGDFFLSFRELVSTGEGQTDLEGTLPVEFASLPSDALQIYTLEVTATDESGLPVSGRGSIPVNPAEFYIGVLPDAWVGQAGSETGFEVLTVDWARNPIAAVQLRAEFRKVTWERVDPTSGDPYELPKFIPHYTPVGSTDFATGRDGLARLAFTPPEPGSYQLEVTGVSGSETSAPAGGPQSRTQVTLWVGGPGQAVWPNLPNQRLRLIADQESYQPGQTAYVFVPNPFPAGSVQALVTLERGVILRHEVLLVEGAGVYLSLPLTEEDTPNVYLSVTLLGESGGGGPDFRQGFLNLPVEPVAQSLQVSVIGEPARTGPGETVQLTVRVTDADGNPVEGEFSLAVVDQAVLALADPNSLDILPAFYGNQPLGVRTGLALAAYTHRSSTPPEFLGGGGGGEFIPPPVVREDFLDTAYWSAEILTDHNGEAQVLVNLPDNLTTWMVDVRGLTAASQVGQAEAQVVTTKEMLLRPVAPRFLVTGDHARLATVVQNNTADDLQVEVSIQAPGFDLEASSPVIQQISVPAGGRALVAWWGSVRNVDSIDLLFSARASGSGEQVFVDAARPETGPLPVLHYTVPQTFGTAGVMEAGGEILELVSLPRTAFGSLAGTGPASRGSGEPSGQLRIELSPSLAAAMMNALDALEQYPYASTEQVLSRFLPNLETYRVLQEFSLQAPNLQNRLQRTLESGLAELLARQNQDGGWSWWRSGASASIAGEAEPVSDPYISAYVLFGLHRAREAGVAVDSRVTRRASNYLSAEMADPQELTETWQLDRLAFQHFTLAEAGQNDAQGLAELYEQRDRLNPWAQAMLALALERLSPGDERAKTLLSNLEASAGRSATGAHWEDREPGWRNMSTPIYTSAVVLYALAQQNPASPLVADAVRYLMSHRGASGGWSSTYETAWTLMALAKVIQGTAELGGNFGFSATINAVPFANGQAGGEAQLNPVAATLPANDLYPQAPNALVIRRDPGPGRLYYTAHLKVDRPVEDVTPVNRGITISRAYYPASAGQPGEAAPIRAARAGELVDVRVTLSIPETAYYLLVEDYIPAGAEVLDLSLRTSQREHPGCRPVQAGAAVGCYDPRQPFSGGWGWWYFNGPQIYADRVTWAAETLPPGTYELNYTLVILQPGEYRVLPARAWQFYFPEVQGNSAGGVFEIGE